MTEQCKIIAIVELILGIIGSFLIAKQAGITFRGDRNWITTIIIFLAGVIISYVIFVILYSIYEMLYNQEYIIAQIQDFNSTTEDNSKPASNNSSSLLKDENSLDSEDGWICPRCGSFNPAISHKCKCGKNRD